MWGGCWGVHIKIDHIFNKLVTQNAGSLVAKTELFKNPTKHLLLSCIFEPPASLPTVSAQWDLTLWQRLIQVVAGLSFSVNQPYYKLTSTEICLWPHNTTMKHLTVSGICSMKYSMTKQLLHDNIYFWDMLIIFSYSQVLAGSTRYMPFTPANLAIYWANTQHWSPLTWTPMSICRHVLNT